MAPYASAGECSQHGPHRHWRLQPDRNPHPEIPWGNTPSIADFLDSGFNLRLIKEKCGRCRCHPGATGVHREHFTQLVTRCALPVPAAVAPPQFAPRQPRCRCTLHLSIPCMTHPTAASTSPPPASHYPACAFPSPFPNVQTNRSRRRGPHRYLCATAGTSKRPAARARGVTFLQPTGRHVQPQQPLWLELCKSPCAR